MGNLIGKTNENNLGHPLSLETDLGIGTKQIPRCVTWISPHPVATALVSVTEASVQCVVEQAMRKSSDKEDTFYFVFLQKADSLVEINTEGSLISLPVPFDSTQFLKEFDVTEKMTTLLELLKNLVPIERKIKPHKLMANIQPHFQPDLGTKVVLSKDIAFAEEEKYVQDRLSVNQDCLAKWIETVLQVPVTLKDKHPRIAVCTSGGGFRAAIASRKFTKLLHDEVLLPSITHYSCLSGSTWFMTDWLKNGKIFPEEERDLFDKKASNSDYIDGLFRIWMKYNLPQQIITNCLVLENWANALGFAYFGEKWYCDRVNYRLSDIKLNSEIHPWPIMAAIGKHKNEVVDQWDLYEFTPSFVSKIDSNYSIKTLSFGNKIEKDGIKRSPGVCSDELGQMMAIWGSAMCAEKSLASLVIGAMCGSMGRILFDEIYRNYTDKDVIVEPFEAPNWDPTNLEQYSTIEFRDAGFLNNIPLPTLLQKNRKIDIIIVLDASEDEYQNPYTNMYWTQEWAKKNNVPFPETLPPKDDLKKWRDPQIFESQNGSPAILYLPVGLDPLVPTFELHYTNIERESISKEVEKLWMNSKKNFATFLKQIYCKD